MTWSSTLHPSESGAYHALEHDPTAASHRRRGITYSRLEQPREERAPDEPGENRRSGTLCIAARRLDLLSGWLPASHLSLVLRYTDGDSIEYEGASTTPIPSAYGPIVVHKRAFRPRPDRHGVVVDYVYRRDLNDWEQALDVEVARLNTAAVAYEPFAGPNSNTVVRTLLLRLWLPPIQPAAVAPGFDHEAL